jgi:multiple antibiotic resistance protein
MQSISVIFDFSHFISTVLLAVGALLPIVDPLGGAPIFIAMTVGLAPAERVRMAKSVTINSFLLLIASVLIGAYVLDFFGISIPAVQIAGGVVVCAIAWSLLNRPNSPPALAQEEPATAMADDLGQRAFYPLTMPLTVGPGAISVALTLGANPKQGLRPLVETTLGHALGILIVSVCVYFCYRYADRITKRLGPIGTSVVVRLSAFILLCIGVQICWNGLHTLIVATFPTAAS